MAPARPQFRRLLAAVVVVVSLSAAVAAPPDIDENLRGLVRDPFQATFTGFGKDYFEDKTTVLECLVKPLDHQEIAPFHVGCTRDDIWDYSDTPVTLQLEEPPSMNPTANPTVNPTANPTMNPTMNPTANPTMAQIELETRLNIVRPLLQISAITGGRRRSRRTVADLDDGPRSNLIIRLNMDDMEVDHTTEAQARLMMQSPSAADKDVDRLFQAVSYGGMSFPADLTTVVTVTSPNTSADYADSCEPHLYADHALELLGAQHATIDPAAFQHQTFLLPRGLGNCQWGGTSMIRCSGNDACRSWLREGSASILAHELAHNIGLAHSGSDFDDNGEEEGLYGDAGCLMSFAFDSASGWKSVNALHREVLGYLGDGSGGDGNGAATYDMTCAVPATAQVTLTISRLDLSPVGNPHPNMVRIARYQDQAEDDSDTIDTNYLLSFKSSADWDGGAGDAFRDRLQIHTHAGPDSRENTLLVKTLREGDVFVGRANRSGSPVPLNVRVVSIGTDAVTVTVNTGCVETLRGYTACDLTVSNAVKPNPDAGTDVGGVGVDHVWHFTLDRQMAVTFDGCASSVNTAISAISVFDRLSVDDAGASLNITGALAHADEGCTTDGNPPINWLLDAGDYSVVLARPGGDDQGRVYSMTMQCPFANFRGSMGCGQTVSGDTNDPGIDLVNSGSVSDGQSSALKNAFDHIWHFTLDRSMTVTLDACASRFDTHLSVLGRLEVGDDGEVIPAALYASNDDGCDAPSTDRSRIDDKPLSAGNYSVVIEGYNVGIHGIYSITMDCVATTRPPTRPPTTPPTTPAPTPPTTPPPTPDDDFTYCQAGYDDIGVRWNWGLGKITITPTHEACSARCTQYSGAQWSGGCKGYMTGMYVGMLFCRSYGGQRRDQACASWAHPSHPGMYSGALGSTHPRTNAVNVGGNCCSNMTFVPTAI